MITQENIPYTANEIKAMVKTCEKYNKALEKARDLMTNQNPPAFDKHLIEMVFPELKENEDKDEMIRQCLIEHIKCNKDLNWSLFQWFKPDTIIAWLEKQGEQKHFSDFKAKDWYVSKVDGKIYNMTYNPNDKVEPKFKIGNWITDGHLTCKVLSVTGKSYELHLHNDDYCHFETDIQTVDKYYRLWTIQDAKDGDVLVCEDENFTIPFIAIYKCLGDTIYNNNGLKDLTFNSHCFMGFNGNFYEGEGGHVIEGIHPGTKEQRDLFFHKMKEAGYEWDSEKKELKKIEVASKENGDERMLREIKRYIKEQGDKPTGLPNGIVPVSDMIAWLEKKKQKFEESEMSVTESQPQSKFKVGDKVVINCREEFATAYNGKEGTIINIFDLEKNHWGNIVVVLDNGMRNTFYASELIKK